MVGWSLCACIVNDIFTVGLAAGYWCLQLDGHLFLFPRYCVRFCPVCRHREVFIAVDAAALELSHITYVISRDVDPCGTGGTRPPNIWTGGHYHECPPQYFWSNISYFLSMRYFLDKLKEFLVLILEVNLVSVSGQCCGVSSD